MKKRLALGAVAALALGSLTIMPKGVAAGGACLFTHHTYEHQHAISLSDNNYINVILDTWDIPSDSSCTPWSGHQLGDAQTDIVYQLGTTADGFDYGSQPFGFGWVESVDTGCPDKYFPNGFCSQNPFANGCITYSTDGSWGCDGLPFGNCNTNNCATWGSNYTWSGPNATTEEAASQVANEKCSELSGFATVDVSTGNPPSWTGLVSVLETDGSAGGGLMTRVPQFVFAPDYTGDC